ncbi:MAG: peptidase T, partial [Spirochaetales bacterium]|nr:peptidase T [Spirochaetales bacterium]
MFKEEILERFLRYAVVDTQSIEALADKKHPSFEGEWDLLRLLEKELRELGLTDVNLDEHGYLLARLPATAEGLPTIAFSSHVDTADDVEGN